MNNAIANPVPPAVRVILNWVKPYNPITTPRLASTALRQAAKFMIPVQLSLANNLNAFGWSETVHFHIGCALMNRVSLLL